MPVVIFFTCLDLEQKSSFLDGHYVKKQRRVPSVCYFEFWYRINRNQTWFNNAKDMKEQNSNLTKKSIFNYFKKGDPMLKKNKKVDAGNKPSGIQSPVDGKTIIGEQIIIDGTIRGKEDLLIEGSVKGRIEVETHHLTVGPRGQVEAEIQAANVTISGRLVGNINAAGKVKITKEADFNGEITAKSISVEDGAYLKAVIELKREPPKKPVSVVNPEDKSVSEPAKEPLTLAGKSSKGN